MWAIPLVELNQMVHSYLRRQGLVCRRRGSIDALDEEFDALCSLYGRVKGSASRGLETA